MESLSSKAKEFLRLWTELSPYAKNSTSVVNDKENCRIYFVIDDFDGNVGSFEYHLYHKNMTGFETLEDKKPYKITDLINS